MEIKKIGSNGRVKLNIDKLKNIEKELNIHYVTKVGIMGKKLNRKDGNLTNAEIGLVHEKGSLSRHIPRRSFLELPIFLRSKELVKDMQNILENLTALNLKKSYKLLGISAEKIIQNAFGTQGFGQWQKLKYRKGSPLIDSGQLRKSISSNVAVK